MVAKSSMTVCEVRRAMHHDIFFIGRFPYMSAMCLATVPPTMRDDV